MPRQGVMIRLKAHTHITLYYLITPAFDLPTCSDGISNVSSFRVVRYTKYKSKGNEA